MALGEPEVFHDSLVLYALKHLLGMVSKLGLAAVDEGCQGIKLLHINVDKEVDLAKGKAY